MYTVYKPTVGLNKLYNAQMFLESELAEEGVMERSIKDVNG